MIGCLPLAISVVAVNDRVLAVGTAVAGADQVDVFFNVAGVAAAGPPVQPDEGAARVARRFERGSARFILLEPFAPSERNRTTPSALSMRSGPARNGSSAFDENRVDPLYAIEALLDDPQAGKYSWVAWG